MLKHLYRSSEDSRLKQNTTSGVKYGIPYRNILWIAHVDETMLGMKSQGLSERLAVKSGTVLHRMSYCRVISLRD